MKVRDLLLILLIGGAGLFLVMNKKGSKSTSFNRERATDSQILASLHKTTKSQADRDQFSSEKISDNVKVVKFFYSGDSTSSSIYTKAIEYKVFFENVQVLRFNYFEHKDGTESFQVIEKDSTRDWIQEINYYL